MTLISATYVCPVRGLTGLEPPEADRIGKAAGIAKTLELDALVLPVLEEALIGAARSKVAMLDGLILTLDRVEDAGLKVRLIVPAQRVLGLYWVPPYLAGAVPDPGAPRVFVDRKIRNLWPFDWWSDPSIVSDRIKVLREVVSAFSHHPALSDWIILDHALKWARPEPSIADIFLKSMVAEIREKDERSGIYVGVGWSELLEPDLVRPLVRQVDGLRMGGLETPPPGMVEDRSLSQELLTAAYLGSLAQWLFECPVDMEVGWGAWDPNGDLEEVVEAGKQTTARGLTGITWLNLQDPELRLHSHPPWNLRPDLINAGLLNRAGEPREEFVALLEQVRSTKKMDDPYEFIDLSRDDYLDDPPTHLNRLWNHFRESL